MVSRRPIYNLSTRPLALSVFCISISTIVVLSEVLFLDQFLGISGTILAFTILAVLLIVLIKIYRYGVFLSLYSLRIRSLYQRSRNTEFTSLWNLFKSRKRRQVEILKGVYRVIIAVIVGSSFFLLEPHLPPYLLLEVQRDVIGRTWQVHSVIIGFSFVALTFVWEEIYSNSLSDELTRLFVEDIGSIWTVTFVFGANLVIGFIAFTQSSPTVTTLPAIIVVAILFLLTIVFVAWRFLDALDLLFYTDLDEELKEYAYRDLERERIRERSTPNKTLTNKVEGFKEFSVGIPNFGLQRTTISARDIDHRGRITDLNLRRMYKIAEIVSQHPSVTISQNPTVGRSLAEDTTVLSLTGDLPEEEIEQIKKQLRHGIRTRKKN